MTKSPINTEQTAILQLTQLSARFGPSEVLHDVDLTLHAGEKLALVGESGSGKSVLARAILQLDAAVTYQGQIQYFAASEHSAEPNTALDLLGASPKLLRTLRGRRIAMIFQEPMTALNPLQTIGQQIGEVLQLHLGYSAKQASNKAISLIQRTGIADAEQKMQRYPHQLSGGQRQRVMIAMALAGEPDILIADEPTTALDVTLQAQILQLLADIQRERGMAVLLISHDLNLVRRFADRVAVMQQGRIVETAATEALFDHAEHPYTQALLAARPQRIANALDDDAKPCLSARGLGHQFAQRGTWFWQKEWNAVLSPLDLTLRRGETLAIVGESGSGKTTLILALLRLLQAGRSSGEVTIAEQRFDLLTGAALRAARRDIQIVFQDPFAALSPRMTVAELVGEGLLVQSLSAAERAQRISKALSDVGLPDDIGGRYPHEFSGGQRQRIAIARALIVQPKILLLDEPTSALDATVQQQVLQLLADLQRQYGLNYILVSHDLAVVRALAHRVIVLQQGQVQEEGDVLQVMAAPQAKYTQQLLVAAGVLP